MNYTINSKPLTVGDITPELMGLFIQADNGNAWAEDVLRAKLAKQQPKPANKWN